jgi:putative ABC transport system substrate-binding protein
LTGINWFPAEVAAKRLELLRELVPGAARVAVLFDPSTNTMSNESTLRDLEAAARSLGLQIQVHNASTSHDIDAVFETFVRERPDALFVAIAAFFVDRRVQLALQAMIHKVPVTYPVRDFAEAGGLMSYGASLRDSIRQSGLYAGRILKGAKPADLPVLQSTKFELVINHQTARNTWPHGVAHAARARRRGDRVGLASANAFCCTCSRQLLALSVASSPSCRGLLIGGKADSDAAAR